jgi:hypothetical protein
LFNGERFPSRLTEVKKGQPMKVEHTCCAGLDVHKRTIVACVLTGPPGSTPASQTKTFGTTTPELMEMVEWLKSQGVSQTALEATGSYWMPIYNLLEGQVGITVANAAHMKAVPGRKTDVADAEWIADLLRHGLLRASFIPDRPQRDLRELTRHRRSLAEKRAQAANELQKTLESSNLKLQSVVTDITGVSSTAMLRAMLSGQSDPKQLAELAKCRLRHKIPALERALQGQLRPHPKLILEQILADSAPDKTKAPGAANRAKPAKATAPCAPPWSKRSRVPCTKRGVTMEPSTGASPHGAARKRPWWRWLIRWLTPSTTSSKRKSPTSNSEPISSTGSTLSNSCTGSPNASSISVIKSK